MVAFAFALVASAANVSLHWGGVSAPATAVPACAVMAACAIAASRFAAPFPTEQWREQLWLIVASTMVSAAVVVLSGGSYMGERFSTSQGDLDGRLKHWSASVGVLSGPIDWVYGKGLGRYPATYFYRVPETELPGSYAWKQDAGNGYLSLSGPRYSMSLGRFVPRRAASRAGTGGYTLMFDLRADTDIEVHAEVCEKHLLYNEHCAVVDRLVKVGGSEWQQVRFQLDGGKLSRGPWYAPRLAFFSLAVGSSGHNADFDNVSLDRAEW